MPEAGLTKRGRKVSVKPKNKKLLIISGNNIAFHSKIDSLSDENLKKTVTNILEKMIVLKSKEGYL